MRNALVIAAREFEEKRFVAYAAVAFAVMPFLIGVIPMVNGKSPQESIVILAVILATGFTTGLGVITGAGLVGRDLSDGRMSFYFSRPIGAKSIWFGKLIAGVLLIVGCFGLIAAPARFIGSSWKGVWDITFPQFSGLVLGIAISLFLIAHVIGTFARSRSPLIAFDFVAAVVCGVAVRFLVLPLVAGLATNLVNWLLIALGAALFIAIVGGGAWQLERGRIDRRGNHLALSHFLWSVMGVALLLAAGYVAWVVSAKPADLTSDMSVTTSPGSPFVTVTGKTATRGDYTPAWVMNTEDGRNIRIDAPSSWGVQYTRDGRSVFWPVMEGKLAELRRYTRGDAGPVDTGLTISSNFYFPSDDGKRIATVGQGILSIYDVAQKLSLASARIPDATSVRGLFVTPDRFRLYARAGKAVRIFELDVQTRAFRETGGLSLLAYATLSIDPTATRMVVHLSQANIVTLNDAQTGVVLRTLLTGSRVAVSQCLRDGRIVITDISQGASVMHVFAPDGSPLRVIPLGPPAPFWFIGDDGTRVVLMTDAGGVSSRALLAIDVNRGVIERRETNISDRGRTFVYDLRPAVGPLRESVYIDKTQHVMAWNPATGAKRRIAG